MKKQDKHSVFIIDDENNDVATLTKILSSDYTVYAAKSGRDAIKMAKMYLPDVILLDILMPKMDGYETLVKLKNTEETRNIPVIFVTGLTNAEDEEKGLRLGAADYITKPFTPAVVKLRVQNQIKLLKHSATKYDVIKYKLANDALNVALWDAVIVQGDPLNANNSVTYSQEFRLVLGFSNEKDFPNLAQSWIERLHREDKVRSINIITAHIIDRTGKTPFDIECRLMLKTGEYRYFRLIGTTLRDSAGVPLKMAGALVDINEKKLSAEALEKALSDSQKTLGMATNILNNTQVMIYVSDKDTDEILFVNDYMKQHFEIDDEIVGKPCYKIFNEGLNERCEWCPCRQLDKEPDRAIVWEERNTKTNRYYRNADRYIDWPGGKKAHIQCSIDLTDVMQAQEALKQKQKMLSAQNEMTSILLSQKHGTFNETIDAGLNPIADAADVDRIVLYRLADMGDEKRFEQIYNWGKVHVGTTHIVDETLKILPPLTEISDRVKSALLKGDYVHLHKSIYSEDEAALLDAFGVKSILLLPVFINGKLWGGALFENKTEDRLFGNDNIDLLRSTAFTLVNAFMREDMALEVAKVNEHTTLLLDASPLCCELWSSDLNILACNELTVKFFGVSNKQEYLDGIFDFSPEFQPDGQRSDEKTHIYVKRALAEGNQVIDWTHRLLDGTLVPVEITLAPVKYGDDRLVAVYTRDLREHTKMINEIHRRDNLLEAVNQAANVLLAPGSYKTFEFSLLRGMKIIGRCVDVDCVEIWQNEMRNGELHSVLTHFWYSEIGRQIKSASPSSSFSYNDTPGWERRLSRGEYIRGPVSGLSQEDQNFLGSFGIKSMLTMPLFVQEKFWGLCCIDDCRNERDFTDEEADILRSGSLMIVNAINSNAQIAEINEAHNRGKLMLDSTPLCAQIWDKNLNIIDCNEACVKLYGLKSKQEYIDKFFELSPEYQPDGQRSDEASVAYLTKAFEEGYCSFEWLHRMIDDTFMPTEVIIVRVKYGKDNVLVGYTRDLREYKKMMDDIRYRDHLLQSINHAAALLFDSDINSFENSLWQAMKMIGETAKVDRMYIFKNYTQGGQLYCTQLYEWSGTVQPQQGSEFTSDILYCDSLLKWKECLSKGKCINSLVRNAPPKEQTHLSLQNIVSILVAPIFINDQFWGFVGFDDCRNERVFTETEEMILRSGGMLFVNARLRNDMLIETEEAHKLTKDMLDSSPLCAQIWDKNLDILDCNEAAVRLYGFKDKQEYMNRLVKDCSPEYQPNGQRSADAIVTYVNKAFEEGYCTFEWMHRMPCDGSPMPAEITLVRSNYRGENVVIGYARDMREHVKMMSEINLRTNELAFQTTTLQTIIDSIPDLVFCKDLNLNYTLLNKSATNYFGVGANDVIGKGDFDGIKYPAEVAEKLISADKELLLGNSKVITEDVLPSHNGSLRTFETTKVPLMQDGAVVGLVGLSHDITEKTQMINDMEYRSSLLNAVNMAASHLLEPDVENFENCLTAAMSIVAKTINIQQVYLWQNHMHGGELCTTMKHSWLANENVRPDIDLITDVPFRLGFTEWEEILSRGDCINSLVRNRPESEIKHPAMAGIVSILVAPVIVDKRFWGFIGICDHVNERIFSSNEEMVLRAIGKLIANAMMRQDIAKSLQFTLVQATEASKAKGDFLSAMSHEMRTPMNAIIGMTAIGKRADDVAAKNHALNKIGDASSHLLGVINDVLDMAKIEADKLELAPVEYSFEKMLQKVMTIVHFRVDEKQQELSINIDKKIPHFVVGDDQRLAQVIANLLSNAVKFTPLGGQINFDASLVEMVDDVCELRIEVSDNGIGIPLEKQDKLFHAFVQAESGTSREYGGTGLGLVIAKRIVELMDGKIWVESSLGDGAKFIFTVKAKRGKKNSRSLLAPDIDWKNVRILVVDDMSETREQFQDIFKRLNITCDVAVDGVDARRIIDEQGSYDIYFIDWRMPRMNGIELTKKIKSRDGDRPSVVIMITAMDWEQIKFEASRAGVDRHLLKPLFSSDVIDCINECLGNAPDSRNESVTSEPENLVGAFKDRKMLLAEDIEINREIIMALLEDTGLIIKCAENGQEAVDMITASPEAYDIVFMDVQMPKMDGLEATRRIRSLPDLQGAKLPIIAMTANVFKSDIEECLAAGMDDHLGKPVDVDRMLEVLRTYLNKSL